MVVVTVAASIASENVAVGAVAVDWFVALLAGVKAVTVGGVVSTRRGRGEGPGHVRGEAVAGDVGHARGAAQDAREIGPAGDEGGGRREGRAPVRAS